MTIGREAWTNSRGLFANGLDRALSVPANPLVAASGAWSSENTFTVKIVLSETPYYSTLNFKYALDDHGGPRGNKPVCAWRPTGCPEEQYEYEATAVADAWPGHQGVCDHDL